MQGGKRISGITGQKQSPVVSVITIVYNGGELLEGTIQSVLKQILHTWNILSLDGDQKIRHWMSLKNIRIK